MFNIYKVNNTLYPYILNVEFPNMLLAGLISKNAEIACGWVMIAAILTTAISCGFSFLKMLNEKNYERNALIMCITAFLCSKFGFSNMINVCFPFFGVLGVFQIILILYKLKSGVRMNE